MAVNELLAKCNSYDEAAKILLEITKSRLPVNSYGKKSFDNWRWQGRLKEEYLVPDAQLELWRAIGEFHKGEKPILLLYGIAGVGKTHLAIAMGWQQIAGSYHRVILYQIEVLLDTLRMSYDIGGFSELMKGLHDCNLLILDDFGAHASTEWGVAKLDAIIDYRYSERKQTIITTNNTEHIPERILDRCREGIIVRVKGKSQRGIDK